MKLDTSTLRVTKTQPESWSFQFRRGWAIFTVDDATGCFSIQSDWGDFAYRWPTNGFAEGETLKSFLTDRADPSYIVRKLAINQPNDFKNTFDAEATRKNILDMVERGLEEGNLDGYDADRIRNEVRLHLQEEDEAAFVSAIYDDTFHLHNLFGDLSEVFAYEPSVQYVFLREELIPFFLGYLRGKRAT